jgi:AcrR family transcriptional regulator
VFNADPNAGMADVAAAAGVGRATLYRHYAAREDLIAAIAGRVRSAFRELRAELEAADAPPAVALERFVDGLFALREGSACMAPPSEDRVRAVWAPVRRVIRRWQAEGALDPDVSPEWILAALRGLLRTAAGEVDARRLARRDAAASVVRVLLHGVVRR